MNTDHLLRCVALGYSPRSVSPSHSPWKWLKAIGASLRMLHAFQKGGQSLAYICLERWSVQKHVVNHGSRALMILKAQEDAALLRMWIRLLGRPELCFGESFAITTGLRLLGYDAHILVGYAQIEQFVPNPMHAWVEVASEAVNDLWDIPYLYRVLYRNGQKIESEKQ